MDEIAGLRNDWDTDNLWFRGENSKHKATALVPHVHHPQLPLKELIAAERELWREFKRCAPQLADIFVEDNFEWYFLMQHHNAPTRLSAVVPLTVIGSGT